MTAVTLKPKVQAFHLKGGQGAKTGTGGHLPGNKVKGKIAEVRQLPEGQSAISPPAFCDFTTPRDYKDFADRVRGLTDGVPIGFKLSAQHIEQDIDFALEAGADYIILDGRGGGTGAAPLIFAQTEKTGPRITRITRKIALNSGPAPAEVRCPIRFSFQREIPAYFVLIRAMRGQVLFTLSISVE